MSGPAESHETLETLASAVKKILEGADGLAADELVERVRQDTEEPRREIQRQLRMMLDRGQVVIGKKMKIFKSLNVT